MSAAVVAGTDVSQAQAQAQAPEPVQATSGSQWNVSGFGTVGLVQQSGGGRAWRFARQIDQPGASGRLSARPDTRVGAQLDWNDGNRWEAAVQGVLLDAPSDTPLGQYFPSAYLGFRPTAGTRIQIGRTTPDIFLFADSRNVGFALPWVRPPVDFYGFLPVTSVDGANVEQRWSIGEATWRARVAAGGARNPVTDVNGQGDAVHSKDIFAIGVTREEGGLLLKLCGLRARAVPNAGLLALKDSLAQVGELPVPGLAAKIATLNDTLWAGGRSTYLGVAAQYERGPWTVIAEGSADWIPGSLLNARRGYVSLGWHDGKVTYYGLVSRQRATRDAVDAPYVLASLTPVVGTDQARGLQALVNGAAASTLGFRFDQATVGAGLRWDFQPNVALKVQVDRFNVYSRGGGGWRYYDGSAGHGTLVSVAIDFVVGQ